MRARRIEALREFPSSAKETKAQKRATRRDGKIRWWDILIVVVAGSLAGMLLLVAVFAAAFLVAKWRGAYFTNPVLLNDTLLKSFWINIAILVTTDLGLLAVLWLVLRRRFGPPVAHYFPKVGSRRAGLAVLSGVIMAAAFGGLNFFLSRMQWVTIRESDFERATNPHNLVELAGAIAIIAFFAPFFEELAFRGLLFDWLRQKGGAWLGVIASALIFAFAHGEMFIHAGFGGWLLSGELFIAGVLLALWVLRTGSLRSSFAMHATYNAVLVTMSLLWP